MWYWNSARLPYPIVLRPGWGLQPVMRRRLETNLRACLPYIVIAMTANFADSILTSIGLRFGYAEANPVASFLLSNSVCIFAKHLFIPVVAVLGALLLTTTLYRVAAKSFCLLLVTIAALNLCTLTIGHSLLPEPGEDGAYTRLSWFLGVYASMAVAFVVALVHDRLANPRSGKGRR